MAESLNKISGALDKSSVKVISQSAFMDSSMLPSYTGMIVKQIKGITNQRDIMVVPLQSVADASSYQTVNFSDTNDMNVIQSRLRELTGYSKKLFDLNGKLSDFAFKAVVVTGQQVESQNEFKEKLDASSENVYLPILENIEKNKKTVESLQQEVDANTNTITDLKKTIAGASTSKDELQQLIQQKRSELVKVKKEYSNLKLQIENAAGSQNSEQLAAVTVATVKNTAYPELYHNLKGKVMEYNSKWGCYNSRL